MPHEGRARVREAVEELGLEIARGAAGARAAAARARARARAAAGRARAAQLARVSEARDRLEQLEVEQQHRRDLAVDVALAFGDGLEPFTFELERESQALMLARAPRSFRAESSAFGVVEANLGRRMLSTSQRDALLWAFAGSEVAGTTSESKMNEGEKLEEA